jgi:hypothetical protein
MPRGSRPFLVVALWCALLLVPTSAVAARVITNQGVGALHLGATVKSLHGKHLIGGLRKGCELDPGQRVAPLKAPLKGTAVFASGGNRVSALIVERGVETNRHVKIGSTQHAARTAYPSALLEPPGTAGPFDVGFLWVPNLNHPKMTLIIDPDSHKIDSIGVPVPDVCE